MSMNRIDEEILLNQLAQGLVDLESGLRRFCALDGDKKQELLRNLSVMTQQAGARFEDVPLAIEKAKLKATYTPCVQLTSGSALKEQLSRALQLPTSEYEKLFRLLLALLQIADNRRQQKCGQNCSHWWHRNLADTMTLASIREEYAKGNL